MAKMYAVVPLATLWKESVIKVYFMNDKAGVKYEGEELSAKNVMEKIVQDGWKFDEDEFEDEHPEHVPLFQQVDHPVKANIRVQFECEETSRGGSWSKLGVEANEIKLDSEPTMVLDLKDCRDDYHVRSTILHEFGHAYGLAHEHQHPDYLTIMEEFIDIDATMDCYGIEKPREYHEQFGKKIHDLQKNEYDPDSIMHYPTKVEMLKEKYRNLRKPEDVDTDPETKGLNKDEKDMLKQFMRHINFVPGEPSKEDKLCLVRAYYDEYKKSPEYQNSLKAEKIEAPKAPKTGLHPSVKYFNLIKYTDDNGEMQFYRLTEHVSAKWKKFGQQIGITENDLTGIHQKGYTNEERFDDVMQKWLDGHGMNLYPYTWEGVEILLKDVRFEAQIPKLQEAVKKAIDPQ